jgi:3'(2'), 5'-bisphosphate nucleotidase
MDLSHPDHRRRLLEGLITAALEAGVEINRIFEAGFEVETKADESPVTIADRAGEAIILKALAALTPDIPVVAEEEAAAGRIPEVDDRFFLVDALDGTREFVRRGDDFTVNIGLIEDGAPSLGVIYAPRLRRLFVGDAKLSIAWRREDGQTTTTPLRIHKPARIPPTAVASRSHVTPEVQAYLAAIKAGGRVNIGSSLKFGLLASGEADVYPRPSPTMEWDTAAGHAVLLAAGGQVFAPDGTPLRYKKPNFFNPGFLAIGDYAAPPLAPFMPEDH